MKRQVIAITFALFCCSCVSFSTTTRAVENGSVQSTSATAFAVKFQQAVKNKNLDFIGSHLAYPVPVYLLGSSKDKLHGSVIATSKQGYADWMTPYLYKLIEDTAPRNLVKMLDIKKGPSGKYLIHNLQYTADPNDHKYSKYSINSDKALYHILDVLRKSAKSKCANCVAKVVEFPIKACLGGKWTKISGKQEFVKNYDKIVTPEVKNLMEHAWKSGNWTGFPMKGIMLGGSGDIWIQSFGHKNAQGFYVWETKVTALHEVESPGCS